MQTSLSFVNVVRCMILTIGQEEYYTKVAY